MKVNINDYAYVKLTESGLKKYLVFKETEGLRLPNVPKPNLYPGYYCFLIWELIMIFGQDYKKDGYGEKYFEDNEIIIEES